MSPGPVKRYRARSRNRALGNQQRTELREKALEMAQRGLNRRGGPVDKGPPAEQKAAADRLRNEHAQALGEAQGEKQRQGRKAVSDQRLDTRAFQLHRNTTGNARSGGLFRRKAVRGGELHDYPGTKNDVVVRKPAASRETGPTAGTYNRHKPASRGSQDLANQLAQRRVTENRPKARRKLFARG
jgi:hypothetical protein